MNDPGNTVALDEHLLRERWLMRLVAALVRDDRDDAEDVAQQARVALWLRPPRQAERARSWLGTVVRNLVRNRARARDIRRAALERAPEPMSPQTPEALAERFALSRRLADLVQALDEPYRQTLLLRYYEGLSAAAIARRLRVPSATVRGRVKDGIDRLRARLDEQHAGDRSRWLGLFASPYDLSCAPIPGTLGTGILVAASGLSLAVVVAVVAWTAQPVLGQRPSLPGQPAPALGAPAVSPATVAPAPASTRPSSMPARSRLPALLPVAGAESPPVSRDQVAAIAARVPPGGVAVTLDDAIFEALARLVGNADARQRTRAALERMAGYEALVHEVLVAFDVPGELAALGLVESGFDGNVRSERAVGLWQLTEGTARRYGLVVSSDRDERLDPRRATEAVASLLRDLHRRFGDWQLAVAAYHQGPGAVARAITQGGTRSAAELQARGLLTPYRAEIVAAVLVRRAPGLAQ